MWLYLNSVFRALSSSVSVLIGAPKANTSQPDITEGGSVFYCPWGLGQAECHDIEFDAKGKCWRLSLGNGAKLARMIFDVLWERDPENVRSFVGVVVHSSKTGCSSTLLFLGS